MPTHARIEVMEAGMEFPSILLFVYGRCRRSVCVRTGRVAHVEHHDSSKGVSPTKNHECSRISRILTLSHVLVHVAFRRMYAVSEPYECVWNGDRRQKRGLSIWRRSTVNDRTMTRCYPTAIVVLCQASPGNM